jgi:hypothetical protein
MPVKKIPNSLNSCAECSRLWKDHARATEEQLHLLEQVSTSPGDFEAAGRLETSMDAAADARAKSWRTIQEHYQQVHNWKLG